MNGLLVVKGHLHSTLLTSYFTGTGFFTGNHY